MWIPGASGQVFRMRTSLDQQPMYVRGFLGQRRLESVVSRRSGVLLPNVDSLDRPTFDRLPDASGQFFQCSPIILAAEAASPSSPLRKGATAGLPSSAGRNPRENTAGPASSGPRTLGNRLIQRAASALCHFSEREPISPGEDRFQIEILRQAVVRRELEGQESWPREGQPERRPTSGKLPLQRPLGANLTRNKYEIGHGCRVSI